MTAPGDMECIMSKQKRVAAVGFCCADVYENLNEWYPTGNGVDFGVHLARAGGAGECGQRGGQ